MNTFIKKFDIPLVKILITMFVSFFLGYFIVLLSVKYIFSWIISAYSFEALVGICIAYAFSIAVAATFSIGNYMSWFELKLSKDRCLQIVQLHYYFILSEKRFQHLLLSLFLAMVLAPVLSFGFLLTIPISFYRVNVLGLNNS